MKNKFFLIIGLGILASHLAFAEKVSTTIVLEDGASDSSLLNVAYTVAGAISNVAGKVFSLLNASGVEPAVAEGIRKNVEETLKKEAEAAAETK